MNIWITCCNVVLLILFNTSYKFKTNTTPILIFVTNMCNCCTTYNYAATSACSTNGYGLNVRRDENSYKNSVYKWRFRCLSRYLSISIAVHVCVCSLLYLMLIVAEIVQWTPIGDHYLVSLGNKINVYDVQVKPTGAISIIIVDIIIHAHVCCMNMFLVWRWRVCYCVFTCS